jgi:hypothetical protein
MMQEKYFPHLSHKHYGYTQYRRYTKGGSTGMQVKDLKFGLGFRPFSQDFLNPSFLPSISAFYTLLFTKNLEIFALMDNFL